MASSSAGLHEPVEQLQPETINRHRALVSMQEELEAIDWYAQHVDTTEDSDLAGILAHNHDEEKEHAAMTLEWLRRSDPVFDKHLRTYLFSSDSILEEEADRDDRWKRAGNGIARDRRPEGGSAMNHLHRELAPITDRGWQLIDDEARQRLQAGLGARRLVEFSGPHGWEHSSTNLGRAATLAARVVDGVVLRQRRVLPLVELRADFVVDREELGSAERGAVDLDFAALDSAATRIAIAENIAVFHGLEATGVVGIATAASLEPVALSGDFSSYPGHVARAVERLTSAGVEGPYSLALGPELYTGIAAATERGDLVLDHLRRILGGPVVRAPGMSGGLVLSLRGGDFLFESGEDLSVGYDHHDAAAVHLYIEESFSFRVASSDAAVALVP